MKYHTSINDIANFGQMFRCEVMPMLGINETIKIASASKLLNVTIDYNRYTSRDNQKTHLNQLVLVETSQPSYKIFLEQMNLEENQILTLSHLKYATTFNEYYSRYTNFDLRNLKKYFAFIKSNQNCFLRHQLGGKYTLGICQICKANEFYMIHCSTCDNFVFYQ